MQKTLFFVLVSDLMDISVKLSAEGQSAEGKLKETSVSVGKTAYNLSVELMGRIFGKENYTKTDIKSLIEAYGVKNIIPRVPQTSTDLRVLHGMLANEKCGLSKVEKVHMDNGETVFITATLSNKVKALEKKLKSIIG